MVVWATNHIMSELFTGGGKAMKSAVWVAMETSLRWDRECRIDKNSELNAENADLRRILREIVSCLPLNRDWLDPALEKEAEDWIK
jgi:hypothetical protein